MSNTKGSLLISNANAVGTALITKLGGTGYKPSEWGDAVNLLGISSSDISTALANITTGSYTGSERGSIKISNLNLVGSMLNKKFNTDRGFKPNEWESAISKLTALEIKTASGEIASFTDGADTVPVKSCTVSFLPSGGGGTPSAPVAITGVSSLTVTNKDNMSTPTHTDTYTDTFGQTIYGGTRDLTTDKASVTYGKVVFDGTEGTGGTPSWTMISVTQGTMFRIAVSDKTTISATNTACSHYTPTSQAQRADGTVSGAGTNVDIIDNRFSSVDAFKQWLAENPVTLVYELATPTELTGLTPHEIDTLLGDNNIYADTGTVEVEYRADIDLALNA